MIETTSLTHTDLYAYPITKTSKLHLASKTEFAPTKEQVGALAETGFIEGTRCRA